MTTKGINFQFTATNKTGPAMQGVQNGLKGMARANDAVTRSNQSMMRGMSDNRRAVQQVGFQVADLSVQIAGGQNAMLAFAQQGGQVLQFFGAFGSVAGAALAVFAAFYMGMNKGGAAIKSAGDAVAEVSTSFQQYEQYVRMSAETTANLTEKFGEFAGQIRSFSSLMSGVQLAETFDKVKASIAPIKGELVSVQGQIAQLKVVTDAYNLAMAQGGQSTPEQLLQMREAMALFQDQVDGTALSMGMTVDQATRLASAIDAIGMTNSSRDMAIAAGDALAILKEVSATGFDLPAPLRAAASALEEMSRGAASAKTTTDALRIGFDGVAAAARAAAVAAQSIGTAAAGAFGSVAALAGKMWEAAQARIAANESLDKMNLAAQYGLYGQGRTAADAANRNKNPLYGATGVPGAPSAGAGGGGGGGGGGTDPLAELREKLKLETEMLGMSEAQQRIVNALGADWQKYGDVVISGLTAQISAIEAFNQKMADQQSIADTIKSSMSDAFMGIVDGTLKAKDAFKSMASAIIRELFNVLVVQKLVGSFDAKSGTGSGIVGFLGGMMTKSFAGGGYTGAGARSGGLDGKGGFLATLHPNETVVDHTAGQGAGGVTVTQNITFGSGVTRAEVQTMIPKIVEATKAAVLDARKRGGSFGGAFS